MKKLTKIIASTLLLTLGGFTGVLLTKMTKDSQESNSISLYSVETTDVTTSSSPEGLKNGSTYGYNYGVNYGNTEALIVDSNWCATETALTEKTNGYWWDLTDTNPNDLSLYHEYYTCSDSNMKLYKEYHHGIYKSDSWEYNSHAIHFQFYQLPSSSQYYGYYGVIVSISTHQNGDGVGYSELGTNGLNFTIKDSNDNLLFSIQDPTHYHSTSTENPEYFTAYMPFLIAPGSYSFSYSMSPTYTDYSGTMVGSVNFDTYNSLDTVGTKEQGNNNKTTNSYVTLPYYATIESQWSLTSTDIELWIQGMTLYATSTISSILQVVNPKIYTSFYNDVISSSTSQITEQNLFISYTNSATNELIHLDSSNIIVNNSAYVEKTMDVGYSWNGMTNYTYFLDVDVWQFIDTPQISSTSTSSVDLTINVTSGSRVSSVQYSLDGGYTFTNASYQINGNSIQLTINNLSSNTYYDNVYIKVNNTTEAIKVPPFYTSYVASTVTTITNSVSAYGTETLVQINYQEPSSNQIISYSLNGNGMSSVSMVDESVNYDQFVIRNLTPNTYYDLKIYNNGIEIISPINDIYTINKDAIKLAEITKLTNASATFKLTLQDGLKQYLDQFNFYYTLDGGSTITKITDSDLSDEYVTFTINNLSPGTRYTANFFIENKDLNNLGQTKKIVQTQTVTFTTLLESPADTTGKTATNTISSDGTSTQVKVNYVDPVNTQNIKYSLDGGNTWIQANVIEDGGANTSDRFTISNLSANNYYNLEIMINNEIVTTTVNNIYTITSDAIVNVYTTELTSTSVKVSVEYADGLISYKNHLNLYYSINGGEQIQIQDESSIEEGTITFTINGLTSGLFYTLEFWVENPDLNNGNSTTKIYQNKTHFFTKG